MKNSCYSCFLQGVSCCQGTQIYLTAGDVQRISQFLEDSDFFTIEIPDAVYLDAGNDPKWLMLTVRPDGQRRVLKRTAEKNCTMLRDSGCRLPMSIRPLVCRLYPYEFTESGVSGIDPVCPISRAEDCASLMDRLGMTINAAGEWHRLLYRELHQEKTQSMPTIPIGPAEA